MPSPAAVMRLEDAERATLLRLDPERDRRIELSFYVTEGELQAAAPGSGPDNWLGPEAGTAEPHFPEQGSGRVLAFVVASTHGMDIRAQFDNTNRGTEPDDPCIPVPSRQRQQIVEVWDMLSGTSLGAWDAMSVPPTVKDLAKRGRRHIALPSLATRTPMPTTTEEALQPTASPELTPPVPADAVAIPLGLGEVPAALVDVARDWPAAVGSRWVYRVGSTGYGWPDLTTAWSSGRITETVDAAWQIAPDVMVSRINRQVTIAGPPDWTPRERDTANLESDGFWEGNRFRYTFRNGLVADLKALSLAEARAVLGEVTQPTPQAEDYYAALGGFLRLPIRPPEALAADVLVRQDSAQDTAVGRFDDCYAVRKLVSLAGADYVRLCRGVGVVRRDGFNCKSMYGGSSVQELIDYSLPAIKPVERQVP
jgi:hypothetical protein